MILIFILYEFMYLYHYRMGNQFDFGMLAQNWDELFNFEAGNLVLSSAASRLKLKDYVNITVLSFILIYYGIFKDKLKPREREYKVIQFTFAAIIFLRLSLDHTIFTIKSAILLILSMNSTYLLNLHFILQQKVNWKMKNSPILKTSKVVDQLSARI